MKSLKVAPLIGAMVLAISAFVFSLQPAQLASAANPQPQVYSETHDFGNLADGAGESNTVVTPGAALGDACAVSLGVSTAGGTLTCNVSAANTALVRLQNESGGALDLASTTVRIYIWKPRQF